MAIYQGARRRAPLPLGLDALVGREGRREDPAPTARRATSRLPAKRGTRRAAKSVAAARRRPSSVGIALAAIVLVFGAAFLSLSQSVRVAATSYDIVRLVTEGERLQAISQDLRSDVDRLRSEYAIRKQALDAGMGQLGAPMIVQAR
jgi:cell division protein FtsB